MSLILHKAEDPRDTLSKASRYELCQVAAAHGIREVNYSAELTLEEMVKILRNKGVTDIKIPDRPLGLYKPVVLGLDGPPLATMEEPAPEQPETPVAQMGIRELRSECKRRGIKMARTDNLHSLREKLGG